MNQSKSHYNPLSKLSPQIHLRRKGEALTHNRSYTRPEHFALEGLTHLYRARCFQHQMGCLNTALSNARPSAVLHVNFTGSKEEIPSIESRLPYLDEQERQDEIERLERRIARLKERQNRLREKPLKGHKTANSGCGSGHRSAS